MKVFKHLNPESKPNPTLSTFGIDYSLWGVEASIEQTNLSLAKTKLSLYQHIAMNEFDLKSPL
jgi:hypothetical protein